MGLDPIWGRGGKGHFQAKHLSTFSRASPPKSTPPSFFNGLKARRKVGSRCDWLEYDEKEVGKSNKVPTHGGMQCRSFLPAHFGQTFISIRSGMRQSRDQRGSVYLFASNYPPIMVSNDAINAINTMQPCGYVNGFRSLLIENNMPRRAMDFWAVGTIELSSHPSAKNDCKAENSYSMQQTKPSTAPLAVLQTFV